MISAQPPLGLLASARGAALGQSGVTQRSHRASRRLYGLTRFARRPVLAQPFDTLMTNLLAVVRRVGYTDGP